MQVEVPPSFYISQEVIKMMKREKRENLVEMTEGLLEDTSKLIFKLAAEAGINLFDLCPDDGEVGLGKDYLALIRKSGEVCKEQARLLSKIDDLDTRFDGMESMLRDIQKAVNKN